MVFNLDQELDNDTGDTVASNRRFSDFSVFSHSAVSTEKSEKRNVEIIHSVYFDKTSRYVGICSSTVLYVANLTKPFGCGMSFKN